jgi:hypothetical protein
LFACFKDVLIISLTGVFLGKGKYNAGFLCVRGFDIVIRAPRPLFPHLHLAACKVSRSPNSATTKQSVDSTRASVANDLLPPDDIPDEAPEEGGKEVPEARPTRKNTQPPWLEGYELG